MSPRFVAHFLEYQGADTTACCGMHVNTLRPGDVTTTLRSYATCPAIFFRTAQIIKYRPGYVRPWHVRCYCERGFLVKIEERRLKLTAKIASRRWRKA